jgi:hypothetical protein
MRGVYNVNVGSGGIYPSSVTLEAVELLQNLQSIPDEELDEELPEEDDDDEEEDEFLLLLILSIAFPALERTVLFVCLEAMEGVCRRRRT